MSKYHVSWETNTLDLPGLPGEWDGKYGRLKGFWLLFLLLRISPSYELARRASLGPLTREDAKRLPSDFEEVANTFEMLGDVQHVYFAEWWRERGVRHYGRPAEPRVRQVAFLDSAERSSSSLHSSLEWHFEYERPEDGWPDAVLVSIPIGAPHDLVLKHVSGMLKAFAPIALAVPTLNLVCRLTDAKVRVIDQGVRLMLARAAYPGLPMWKIGAIVTPYRANRAALESTDKLTRDRAQMNLSTSTNRDLKKYERVAENAARGKYPTEAPVERCAFDYPGIGEQLATISRWRPPTFTSQTRSRVKRQAK